MANEHGRQVAGIKFQGFRFPWDSKRHQEGLVDIEILEIHHKTAWLRIGNDYLSTGATKGDTASGCDQISCAINQALSHVIEEENWTGYSHNYYFEHGIAYPVITEAEGLIPNFSG